MTTIVYKYGLRAPSAGIDLVRAELRHAYNYRCELVQLDTARRDALRAFDQAHGGGDLLGAEVAARQTEAAKEAAWQAVMETRKRARGRAESDAEKAALATARAAHKAAMERLREARRVYRETMTAGAKAERLALLAAFEADGKRLAAATPTQWGTKGLVRRAHDQAVKDKPMLYAGLEPSNLDRPRWDGSGRLGVQVQGGAAPAEVLDAGSVHTQVRVLRAAPAGTIEVPARVVKNGKNKGKVLPARTRRVSGRAERDYRVLLLRVGSTEAREPVWAEFPMLYDRPLPLGARIKSIAVRCRHDGPNEEWTAGFTLEMPETEAECGTGVCAVDVGWRALPEGLRVAVAFGTDGASHELVLPAAWIERVRYAEAVRGLKDKNLDRVVRALVRFRDTHGELPPWFLETTATIAHWRGAHRLVRLTREWTDNRFAGDDLFESLEWWGEETRKAHWRPGLLGWLRQDRHLWQLATDVRDNALNKRKDLYRHWARDLATRYATVVFEDFDKTAIARRTDKAENETSRTNRQMASVSELETVVRQGFVRRGGCGHERIDAAFSTHECSDCHHVDAFDAGPNVTHACTHCGVVWDQDDNAARVLLDRFLRERSGDGQIAGSARGAERCAECHGKKENHFAKLKRLKRERLAQEKTAREGAAEAAEAQ